MATSVNTGELLKWFQDPVNRCYFNSDLLSVKPSPISSGVGVFAKKTQSPIPSEDDVEENNLLLRVHKSMVLSPQNSTISNLLFDHGLSGMYGLVLAFIYEKEMGDKSPWWGYLNTISYIDNKGNFLLPLCLHSDKEKNLLKGTEVDFMGGLDSDDLLEHFQTSCQFAKDVYDEVKMAIPSALKEDNLNEFAAITLAVASRAFEIDNYIELGLVPGADLFNHDAYGEENVHFVTLGEVCPYCGKEEGCWHEEYGPPDSEEEEEEKDEEDEEDEEHEEQEKDGEAPSKEDEGDSEGDYSGAEEIEQLEEITMDYVEKMEKELKEEKERKDAEDEEESETSDNDDDEEFDDREFYMNPDECCDIVLERKIVKNKEVYNTYGDLPNAVLLVKYGFSVEDNVYESLCIGPQIVKYRKENPNLEERLDWWSCMGWILLKEEEKINARNEEEEEDSENEGEEDDEDDEDEDEDDDDEESWLFQCRVEYPGKANSQLRAVARLLTMSADDFEKMVADENCDGEMIMKELAKKKLTKECKMLLKRWIQERYATVGDGKTRSGELKRQLKKTDPRSAHFCFIMAVLNEKKLLENALNSIK